MAAEPATDRLFRGVLFDGTDQAIEAWIASGPDAVRRLQAELSGESRVEIPEGMHSRDFLDNLTWACHLLGAAHPDEFLDTFMSPDWYGNPFVISGLGGTLHPRATRRLMRLLTNDDEWVRVNAAVALCGHRHRGLRSVLLSAMDDPSNLVRYHVEERLEELGQTSSL